MSGYAPTGEQQNIIDAAATGANITIEAGAGTGKTSTLKFLADALGRKRGAYLAYNRSIAGDAAKKFPSSVMCKTSHSMAFGAVGRNYRARLDGPRIPANQAAVILGIYEPIKLAGVVKDAEITLAPAQLARLVGETIQKFCYSDDRQITPWHVPLVQGVDRLAHRELARHLAPIAQRAWDTDLTQQNGRLRFTHDMYLKMWILSDPQLNADYVLLDEAQDSNPAVAGLVARQNAQQILVGDRAQAIYGWRGATDAMQNFDGQRFYLSKSFRFGQAVADEANKWLSLVDGTDLRLTGFDQIPSRLADLDTPDAVLCRSNGGAISRVIAELDKGRRTALVGGGKDIKAFARAAQQLMAGRPCDHPELMAFSYWSEVQDYVQAGEGSDLKVLVNLIDRYGADELASLVDRLTDERHADVVVSTAHKSKGREWNTVQIATDFQEPKESDDPEKETRVPREDAMLAYVAVTRAQRVLDREGLEWVDKWVQGAAPAAAGPAPEVPVQAAPVRVEAAVTVPAVAVEVAEPVTVPVASGLFEGLCRRCRIYRNPKCTTCGTRVAASR
ncbi:ATP-dependent helicase [Micromonospora sp. 15K316]|uniref:UvrD-helicase domain-containing protein n=1 Tax=Micromonospora sp. 15K316 TaxID=2530376 RepID=UPI00104E30DC|nr:UvrD-helicase domain-containing protein [Micromonospora sp. 15K316]TDC34230.1 ATP-dependent helicase [Micromonospora sp. 15K316]